MINETMTPEELLSTEDATYVDNSTTPLGGTALVPSVPVPSRQMTISIPEDATPEERLTLMSYFGDSEPLWNHLGETLDIVGVVSVDDYRRDENGQYIIDEETGEVSPCHRTLWRDAEGHLYNSQSEVAYGFCRDKLWPVMTRGGKPGNLLAVVPIKIMQRGTRNGMRTFKFDIVIH